jgi:hypothetical protein
VKVQGPGDNSRDFPGNQEESRPGEFQYNLLKAENERFRKALEKYADPERHSMDPSGFVWSGDYFDYETARAALEGE